MKTLLAVIASLLPLSLFAAEQPKHRLHCYDFSERIQLTIDTADDLAPSDVTRQLSGEFNLVQFNMTHTGRANLFVVAKRWGGGAVEAHLDLPDSAGLFTMAGESPIGQLVVPGLNSVLNCETQ